MDTKEYERLVSLYLGSIYRVALNGCSCSSDAEDVVQNTFVKLWERKEAFPEDEGTEIWSHDGRIYIWDGDIELDITEDFEDDGHARGTYVVNGVFKRYA